MYVLVKMQEFYNRENPRELLVCDDHITPRVFDTKAAAVSEADRMNDFIGSNVYYLEHNEYGRAFIKPKHIRRVKKSIKERYAIRS